MTAGVGGRAAHARRRPPLAHDQGIILPPYKPENITGRKNDQAFTGRLKKVLAGILSKVETMESAIPKK